MLTLIFSHFYPVMAEDIIPTKAKIAIIPIIIFVFLFHLNLKHHSLLSECPII